MAALIDTRILLRKIKDLRCLTPRRNRVKAKWATTQPKYPATNLALQNFDSTYGLQLGAQWPSVRVSMLCEQKYGALLNNLSSPEEVEAELRSQGCVDFVGCSAPVPEGTGGAPEQDRLPEVTGTSSQDGETEREIGSRAAGEVTATPRLSPNIRCLVYPKGDISRFKPARPRAYGLLGYYLLDAASVLPALVLDVQEGHSVLDLCAAPGGKALALLQTGLLRFLCVNDVSSSRTARLRAVLRSFVHKELLTDDRVRITSFDGRKWEEFERNFFDRVLVDVPCTTDRHSLIEEENNIFKRARTKERQRLPQVQVELLLSGIQAARPGGEVVYSTCSLSQLQNQYVVEQALQQAREEHGVALEVVDLRPLTHLFRDTFHFAPDTHLGELVLPHLSANFGPIYLCKLRRLN
ncbi:5-methylcytosine rRNA methyltransferase NSUN4 [Osmerus eperlanus]|uniref:5-methylcytosine rRNA methyltransferase NSUN4 n=1 Tax=Osmerus eperlanus TaxID=29151 RepID=UPI002E136809